MNDFRNLIIERTQKTPQIELNYSTGELLMDGKSIPENAGKVYEPVLNWVNRYIQQPKPVTNLRLSLEYFNTSSSLWISKIIKTLTRINNPDYQLLVHIYIPLEEYDDMKDLSDVKDVFSPITDILQDAIPSVRLKLYATDEVSQVVRDALVLF